MRLHAPYWPWALAVVCALGLLLAFQHVVQTSAQQGAERLRSAAAASDAIWRCNYALDVGPRESCRAQPTKQSGPINAAVLTNRAHDLDPLTLPSR